jgi:NAD(P)-dependent dehydrogenase (short-subunit alcohol dehydrogenase family)
MAQTQDAVALLKADHETVASLFEQFEKARGAGRKQTLALNLVEKGIRVNGVAPGPIWTPLNPSGGQPPEKIPEFGKSTPMKRPGQPNEVAPCFLFLACEDSSYMTGQVLHPDGGNTTSS